MSPVTDDSAPAADGSEPEEDAETQRARTRSSAQGTASDLARMGIDPQLLGLDSAPDSSAPPHPPAADPEESTDENVVHLRSGAQESSTLPASGTSRAWSPAPPPMPGNHQETTEPDVPIESLLGGSEPSRPSTAPSRHFARALTLGLVTPDAAEAAERERAMVNRVRTRQTEHRVVAFIAGKGGIGTTTVALGVGSVLAALRDDATTLATLRSGTPSLAKPFVDRPAPTARELARDDVEVSPLQLPGGLRVVDGPRWGTPTRRQHVPRVIDRLAHESAFSLFDVGNDPGEAANGLLSRADQVLIVTGPGPDNIDAAKVAAERAADIDPYLLDSAIYVVVCQRETATKRVSSLLQRNVPAGGRVVAVPSDPALSAGQPLDPGRLMPQTRLALIDLAGLVSIGTILEEPRQ